MSDPAPSPRAPRGADGPHQAEIDEAYEFHMGGGKRGVWSEILAVLAGIAKVLRVTLGPILRLLPEPIVLAVAIAMAVGGAIVACQLPWVPWMLSLVGIHEDSWLKRGGDWVFVPVYAASAVATGVAVAVVYYLSVGRLPVAALLGIFLSTFGVAASVAIEAVFRSGDPPAFRAAEATDAGRNRRLLFLHGTVGLAAAMSLGLVL